MGLMGMTLVAMLFSFEVSDSPLQKLYAVLQKTNGHVALLTEEATNHVRSMAVVYVQRSPVFDAADTTFSTLRLEHLIVLDDSDTIICFEGRVAGDSRDLLRIGCHTSCANRH